MDRDSVTGRFLPGNRAAVGARGNRCSKWGNKNALKHGHYVSMPFFYRNTNGCLVMCGHPAAIIPPGFYQVTNTQLLLLPGWENYRIKSRKHA